MLITLAKYTLLPLIGNNLTVTRTTAHQYVDNNRLRALNKIELLSFWTYLTLFTHAQASVNLLF